MKEKTLTHCVSKLFLTSHKVGELKYYENFQIKNTTQ